MGSGSGSLSVATNIDTEKGFILDAAKFGGTIDIAPVSWPQAPPQFLSAEVIIVRDKLLWGQLHTRCFNPYDWGSNI